MLPQEIQCRRRRRRDTCRIDKALVYIYIRFSTKPLHVLFYQQAITSSLNDPATLPPFNPPPASTTMITWHHKLTCKMNLKGQKLRPNMSLYLIYSFSSPRHSSIQPPCHTLTHLLLPTTQSNADVTSPLNKATVPPPSPRCDFMCFLLFTISRFIYFNG